MKKLSLLSTIAKGTFFVGMLFLAGCAEERTDVSQGYTLPWQPATVASSEEEANTPSEEMTIAVPIEAHEIKLVREKHEHQQVALSEANVKELESWWDSLPKPVQSQIKANEIDIEVVSKIRTNDEKTVDPTLNDSQIEETGETLERLIGTETGMTYTVSTTLLDKEVGPAAEREPETHETNIRLVKQIPVKLQQFTTDIFLREAQVTNENIQTLQYWWTHLPLDVQNKIKSRQLTIDITCHSVASIDGATEGHSASQEYVAVMEDLLQRMVGVYKMNSREYSLAQTQTHFKVDEPTANSASLPAKQYIRIALRKNKQLMKAPL